MRRFCMSVVAAAALACALAGCRTVQPVQGPDYPWSGPLVNPDGSPAVPPAYKEYRP